MPARCPVRMALPMLLLVGGCAQIGGETGAPVRSDARSAAAPDPASSGPLGGSRPSLVAGRAFRGVAGGPVVVDLGELARRPAAAAAPRAAGPVERPIPASEAERLRRLARSLPPSERVVAPGSAGPGRLAGAPTSPLLLTGFEGPAFGDAGATFVPPDPELAAGPSHLVAVFNAGLLVLDKAGVPLAGPTPLSSLFAATPGCEGSPFDPNALYDEEADRFFVGVDGGGSSYCMAVTTGPDPTGTWNTYAFATQPTGAFFDYPHAGVGRDAIYLGANLFQGPFLEARVWAIDKTALYAGAAAPAVVTRSTGSYSTPQPANLHGFAQGTWPAAGPHYFLTDDPLFSGAGFGVWAWSDPFGGGPLTLVGEVDVEGASGVAGGFPILAPQNGPGFLESNDWRVQDAEYRNGFLWGVQTIACNPGGGVVNCVRWARIDPTVPAVVEAGILGTDAVHRIFADTAVTHCEDLALGYSRTGAALFPSIAFSGRRAGEAPGLGPEGEPRPGDLAYSAFDGSPYRWGDYTGLTPDPDGLGLWYLGEYSRDLGGGVAGWGTYVGSLAYVGCPILAPAPTRVDFGPVEVGTLSPPLEVALANPGDTALSLTGMTLSDPSRTFLDVNAGAQPCYSTMPTIPAGQSCTVEVTVQPDAAGALAATLTVEAVRDANRRHLPLTAVGYVPCPYASDVEVTNQAAQNGLEEAFACQTLVLGPYLLGATGRLELTAGETLVVRNGTELAGELVAAIDPLLALP